MATGVKPIRSEADYEAAMGEVASLWGAPGSTVRGDRLDVLATLIDAYEAKNHPMDPPDPIEAIKFRMEQQGMTRRSGDHHRHSYAYRRGAGPQTQPLDRNDPTTV